MELLSERVARGVERVPLRTPTLPPATHTNAYLLGEGEFVVVEPASPYEPEQRRLGEVIDARIASGHKLVGAFITHHHADHVGGARWIRDRYGVPLMAHPETARRVIERVPVDREVDEGYELHPALRDMDLELLHTPGHAPGHLCVRSVRDRWMIVGDMVASVGTIIIDPDDGGDMDDYLRELARLAELAPRRLLPAHGDPIDDAVGRLRFYIHHRLAREARVLDAVRGGAEALSAVVGGAYDDTPVALWPLAARSARAHLLRLIKREQVVLRDGRYLPLA